MLNILHSFKKEVTLWRVHSKWCALNGAEYPVSEVPGLQRRREHSTSPSNHDSSLEDTSSGGSTETNPRRQAEDGLWRPKALQAHSVEDQKVPGRGREDAGVGILKSGGRGMTFKKIHYLSSTIWSLGGDLERFKYCNVVTNLEDRETDVWGDEEGHFQIELCSIRDPQDLALSGSPNWSTVTPAQTPSSTETHPCSCTCVMKSHPSKNLAPDPTFLSQTNPQASYSTVFQNDFTPEVTEQIFVLAELHIPFPARKPTWKSLHKKRDLGKADSETKGWEGLNKKQAHQAVSLIRSHYRDSSCYLRINQVIFKSMYQFAKKYRNTFTERESLLSVTIAPVK